MENKFIGNHTRKIDDKSRVSLPSVYKKQIGNEFYISLGIDFMIEIRDVKTFENWIKKFESNDTFNFEMRKLKRMILGNSTKIILDKQGRMNIPHFFINKINEKEIVFIGVGSTIEIMCKSKYNQLIDQSFQKEKVKFLIKNLEKN